jgi:DNA-directed RNA polymerase specialized sigma24 family protein
MFVKMSIMRRKSAVSQLRKPWQLRGKEAVIVELRDMEELTFDEIGGKVGCSGEGARVAYHRIKKRMALLKPAAEPAA